MRKMPPIVLAKAGGFAADGCTVGVARELSRAAIENGDFEHIGLRITDGQIEVPPVAVPSITNGRFSERNVNGHSWPLRHLPKVTKEYSHLSPNWGDWSRGSHITSWSREVYQRGYAAPRESGLIVELIQEDAARGVVFVRFALDVVLDRGAHSFQDDLFFALNLLQENVGAHDVFPSTATAAEYLAMLHVSWEILPVGEREATIALLSGRSHAGVATREKIAERYDLLTSLGPTALIAGSNGFRRYFGGRFADDLVVFENLDYGNAAYVMFEDWPTLSQKSRTELLAGHPDEIVRIPHTADWEARLRSRVSEELRKRQSAG